MRNRYRVRINFMRTKPGAKVAVEHRGIDKEIERRRARQYLSRQEVARPREVFEPCEISYESGSGVRIIFAGGDHAHDLGKEPIDKSFGSQLDGKLLCASAHGGKWFWWVGL